jgi:hypothetical protein
LGYKNTSLIEIKNEAHAANKQDHGSAKQKRSTQKNLQNLSKWEIQVKEKEQLHALREGTGPRIGETPDQYREERQRLQQVWVCRLIPFCAEDSIPHNPEAGCQGTMDKKNSRTRMAF